MKERKVSRRSELEENYYNEIKSSLSTTEWFHIKICLCCRKQSLHFITNYKLKYNQILRNNIHSLFWHHISLRLITIWSSKEVQAKFRFVNHSIFGPHPWVWGPSIIPLGEASLTYGLFGGVYTEIANSLCENLSPHDELRVYKFERIDRTVLKYLHTINVLFRK